MELIDFKAHPAGKFFRDKLADTQQNFQGKYPIPPDYQEGNEISWIMEAMCSPSMRLIFEMSPNTELNATLSDIQKEMPNFSTERLIWE